MEVLTIGSGSVTIYGSFAGASAQTPSSTGAAAFFDTSDSSASVAYKALADDLTRKKKLADATRLINSFGYIDGYTTFAARDALDLGTGDGDNAFPFRVACYLLAGLAAADRDVLEADDTGSNVRSVGAGSSRVEFFNPTSVARGTASILPAQVLALIGPYLAISADSLDQDGGTGATGGCVNEFARCLDDTRKEPW